MKRYYLGFFMFFISLVSVYEIKIKDIQGNKIELSEFKNKIILITAFNGSAPSIRKLQNLDLLQANNKELHVIAVPATDFGGKVQFKQLVKIYDSLKLKITITMPGAVKKESGDDQIKLYRYLTNSSYNNYFNVEVEDKNEIFLISKGGNLFSVLKIMYQIP